MPRASNARHELAHWELHTAQMAVAAFLKGAPAFGIHEEDDLLAIVLEHWLRHRPAYTPTGLASRETYMYGVCRNRLRDLVDAERAQKRGSGVRPASLDQALNEDSDEALHDVVASTSADADVEQQIVNRERRRQLTALRAYLAPEDQQLLDALWIEPRVHVASRDLGISPSTAYGRLKRIRGVAEEWGLRDFL